jgi:hypothetical protein
VAPFLGKTTTAATPTITTAPNANSTILFLSKIIDTEFLLRIYFQFDITITLS